MSKSLISNITINIKDFFEKNPNENFYIKICKDKKNIGCISYGSDIPYFATANIKLKEYDFFVNNLDLNLERYIDYSEVTILFDEPNDLLNVMKKLNNEYEFFIRKDKKYILCSIT